MFDTAKGALQPFIDSGSSVLGSLKDEATGASGTFMDTLKGLINPGTAANVLSTLPGFQFQQQYGTQAVTNALAARGLGGSGGALTRGVGDYVTGLAGTSWQNAVQSLLSGAGLKINALQGFANTGANAAGNLAGGAISSGNAQAQTLGNIGNAQAAGTLGTANALSGGLTGGANSITNALLLGKLLPGGAPGGTSSGGGIYGGGVAPGSDQWQS